jgi:uncharacterized protein YcbX
MQGEELNAAFITADGLLGDRTFALVDAETGQVASAKNPRKWPDFFAYRARVIQAGTEAPSLASLLVTTAQGEEIRGDDPELNERLSRALGRRVTLQTVAPSQPILEQYWPEREGQDDAVTQEAVAAAAAHGTFFDYAPLHIITTSSLARLRALYPAGQIETRRFRPNLVVATDHEVVDFVENAWVGKTLRIGDDLELEVTDPCPRCVMPTLAQGDLARDPGILRAIAHNDVHVPFADRALPSFGVYARVSKPGRVVRGDTVHVR